MDTVKDELAQISIHYKTARVVTQSADLFASPAAGGWSPAHHLYHLALTNKSIFRLIPALLERRMGKEPEEINEERLRQLAEGFFPRGGSSPATLVPPSDFTKEELESALNESLNAVDAVRQRNFGPSNTFDHVYFGPLDAAQWLRFAQLHMEHHLKLIGEDG